MKADAYYAPYVNWAAQNGIVEGVTATTFAPDTNINREQMAVIMANYAKKLGYDLPKTLQAVTFADNAQISSWAKNEVGAMQQAGILAGKANNRFNPKEPPPAPKSPPSCGGLWRSSLTRRQQTAGSRMTAASGTITETGSR